MIEKRNYQRFGPLVIRATFVTGGERREGYLTNVSEGGAFLAVDEPPEHGAEVEIRAVLPWRLGELRATSRVAWRSDGTGSGLDRLEGVGLAFERMDEGSKELLEAYLQKFAELAARIEEGKES